MQLRQTEPGGGRAVEPAVESELRLQRRDIRPVTGDPRGERCAFHRDYRYERIPQANFAMSACVSFSEEHALSRNFSSPVTTRRSSFRASNYRRWSQSVRGAVPHRGEVFIFFVLFVRFSVWLSDLFRKHVEYV
jgi:hypothetical protein